jgi:hypothetical protein
MKMIIALLLAIVLSGALAPAQQQQQQLADSGGGRVEFISPDVHPDPTVIHAHRLKTRHIANKELS